MECHVYEATGYLPTDYFSPSKRSAVLIVAICVRAGVRYFVTTIAPPHRTDRSAVWYMRIVETPRLPPTQHSYTHTFSHAVLLIFLHYIGNVSVPLTAQRSTAINCARRRAVAAAKYGRTSSSPIIIGYYLLIKKSEIKSSKTVYFVLAHSSTFDYCPPHPLY